MALQGNRRSLGERWRLLTVREAVAGAVAIAAVVRLWCLTGVPLTICNDGVWYLAWARQLLALQPVDWHPARTPGYPLFLAGTFAVCGVGPVGVLVAQHSLGCLSAGLIAAMGARFAGARWGLILGVLAALDPAMLGMECYAMSEALAAALLVACTALVLLSRRTVLAAGGLGVAIGLLCLVRPAFQIVAPFLVLAWVLEGWEESVRAPIPRVRRVVALAAIAVGFFATTGAWLVHNWRAGVPGMSRSNAVFLWIGVCEAGLLADDFPLPEAVRAEYDRSVRPAPDVEERTHRFVADLNAWASDENQSLLRRWAVHSIVSAPGAYAVMVARAVGWQLEVFPSGPHARHDEMRWLIWRLSQDGRKLEGQGLPNYNVSGHPGGTELFIMPAGHGPWARYFRWWSNRWWVGVPRVALFVVAVGATGIAAWRRRWGVALVLLGTLVYVGAHGAFLLPPSRYALPCWMVWWVAPAMVWGMIRGAKGRAEEVSHRSVRVPSPA